MLKKRVSDNILVEKICGKAKSMYICGGTNYYV